MQIRKELTEWNLFPSIQPAVLWPLEFSNSLKLLGSKAPLEFVDVSDVRKWGEEDWKQ